MRESPVIGATPNRAQWRVVALERVPVATLLAVAAATIVAGVSAFVLPDGVSEWVLIAGIAVAALLPIAVRVARGEFDLFEPVVLVSFAFLLLWVARPAYNLSTHYSYFGPTVLWPMYPSALLAAFISICAVQVAYHTLLPSKIARVLPSSSQPPGRTTLVVAIVLTVASFVAVAVIAHDRGGFHELLRNRASGYTDVAPFVQESFLIAIPAAMLFLVTRLGRRTLAVRLLAIVPIGVVALMSLPGGDRRYMLPMVFALFVYAFLRRGRRPNVAAVAIVLIVLLVLVIDPLRSIRTGGASYPAALEQTARRPWKPFTTLLRTGDTAMVDSVVMETAVMGRIRLVIPPQVPARLHRLGAPNAPVPFRHVTETLSDTILAPIPRQIWPGKPWKTQTLLIDHFYGTSAGGGCVTLCPAFSFVGEAYADFGLWSVAVLSALFGLALATGYRYFLRFSANRLVQAAYAVGLWLAFHPWEGGMSIITPMFILTVLPLLLVAWLHGRRGAIGEAVSEPPLASTSS